MIWPRSFRIKRVLFYFSIVAFLIDLIAIYIIRSNSQDQSDDSNLESGQFKFPGEIVSIFEKTQQVREKRSKANKKLKKIKAKPNRINTSGCKINDLPLYDKEIKDIYSDIEDNVWKCERKSQIKINRFDETSIQLNWTEVGYKPFCYYRQLSRGSDNFHYEYGIP